MRHLALGAKTEGPPPDYKAVQPEEERYGVLALNPAQGKSRDQRHDNPPLAKLGNIRANEKLRPSRDVGHDGSILLLGRR
jgi:hypothetical protein